MSSLSVSNSPDRRGGGPWIVVVRGELDISGITQVARALADLESTAQRVVALDLREVVHLDSSALRLLLDAGERARRTGRRFVVVAGPDGAVRRLLTLTMLADHVEVVEDPAAIGPAAG